MPISISHPRQRVPMVTASTLEDRTRPALDRRRAARRRYMRRFEPTARPDFGDELQEERVRALDARR
jgi:hypothetical protein